MQIVSDGLGNFSVAFEDRFPVIRWHKGSHYAHIYQNAQEVDVFSFAWEKNETSMLDFTSSLENWMKDND